MLPQEEKKKKQTDVMVALQIIKSAGRPIMEHLHLFREFELELWEHQSNLQLGKPLLWNSPQNPVNKQLGNDIYDQVPILSYHVQNSQKWGNSKLQICSSVKDYLK